MDIINRTRNRQRIKIGVIRWQKSIQNNQESKRQFENDKRDVKSDRRNGKFNVTIISSRREIRIRCAFDTSSRVSDHFNRDNRRCKHD